MQLKTKAIVLSTVKYSDADLIVTLFTAEKGLLSFFLKGIRKAKRAKLKSSQFQVLSCLEIDFNYRENKGLQFIKEAKIHLAFQNLQQNVFKTTMAMFVSEILKSCIQEEEQNLDLYQFLERSLSHLNTAEKFSDFHLNFLVQLTRFLGFYPEKNQHHYTYFNLSEGAFQPEDISKYCISGINVKILQETLQHSTHNICHNLKLNQKRRQDFLDTILYYYELHLEGFRIPKSKAILEQVFG